MTPAMEEYFEQGRRHGRDAEARHQDRHHLRRVPSGAVRHRVQEQGRAAAARRGARLPAEPDRRPRHQGGRRGGRGRERGAPGHQGRSERAVRRARVQDHQRQVRHAHLRARLCGHAEERRYRAEHDQGAQGAHRPHVPDARRQAGRDQGGRTPATSPPSSASRTPAPATRWPPPRTRWCSSAWPSRSR